MLSRGEATEQENLEEMVRTANPEEISIDEDEDDDDEATVEGDGSLAFNNLSVVYTLIYISMSVH